MVSRHATKSPSEREDEQVEHQIKPAPKKKPPRYDRRNKRIEDKDTDSHVDEKDKDLSMNYKDIGGSETALDEAICLVAMRFRGIAPDLEDVSIIKARLGSVDLCDARSFPRLASATFAQIDQKYRHARLRRVMPSADGRRFEMGPPLEPRDTTDPLWPVSTKVVPFKPAAVTAEDLEHILTSSKGAVDPVLYDYNRGVAYREALDKTLNTLNGGKYEHMLDAPTYLSVLTKLTAEDIDLTKDTYVPTENDPNSSVKYVQDVPFDPHQWWGKPAEGHIDVHKDEKWRQLFDGPGVRQRDEDEPWMDRYQNPYV